MVRQTPATSSRWRHPKLSALLLVAALFVSVLVLPTQTAGAASGYTDVADGQYYTEPVRWSVENNITGIVGDRFEPARSSTRGEVAVWLWRMDGRPEASPHSFTDVPMWQSSAVSWMSDTGITTGTSATTFSPDRTLTRGELAAFMWRLAGEPSAPRHGFNDVVKGWQQGAVSWLASTGITTGTSATTFSPDNTLTRAQLITFLYRYNLQYPPGMKRVEQPPTSAQPPVVVTTITVPAEAPAGRCADTISGSVYGWEDCAWSDYRDRRGEQTAEAANQRVDPRRFGVRKSHRRRWADNRLLRT